MDIANGALVERIARVLAGERLSANGQGDQESAGRAVNASWQDYRPEALAVLHTLRAPSAAMAAAGDPAVWERMVLAAIAEAQPDAS
ncbi:hypothetical protein [Sphingomonas mucosissima]|uniref:Uncharacterized protein n=1 Tax=Sphingomonas mucosissima TaxID=370959 RepID=A0A245ZJ03_9SPHN|nr:hypothetical protein [Sphingomonas mucosissima]OWK29723.1 hypothetical protein SPMU_21430 [Sphingomonas mucosissima]